MDEALYFPFAQHYLSDSPGSYSNHDNVDEMIKDFQELDLDKIPPYSAESLRKMIKVGILTNSILISVLLLIILVLLIN